MGRSKSSRNSSRVPSAPGRASVASEYSSGRLLASGVAVSSMRCTAGIAATAAARPPPPRRRARRPRAGAGAPRRRRAGPRRPRRRAARRRACAASRSSRWRRRGRAAASPRTGTAAPSHACRTSRPPPALRARAVCGPASAAAQPPSWRPGWPAPPRARGTRDPSAPGEGSGEGEGGGREGLDGAGRAAGAGGWRRRCCPRTSASATAMACSVLPSPGSSPSTPPPRIAAA